MSKLFWENRKQKKIARFFVQTNHKSNVLHEIFSPNVHISSTNPKTSFDLMDVDGDKRSKVSMTFRSSNEIRKYFKQSTSIYEHNIHINVYS
jgi:hypothetical protein